MARALRVLRAFFTAPSFVSEPASGVATLGWGILAFAAAGTAWPSVELFLSISDSPLWGWLALVLGAGQIIVFKAVDFRWPRPWLRCCAAAGAAWLWGGVTIGAARYWPWPPGISAYATLWGLNVYLMFRAFFRVPR
jgi:hypothetical protein